MLLCDYYLLSCPWTLCELCARSSEPPIFQYTFSFCILSFIAMAMSHVEDNLDDKSIRVVQNHFYVIRKRFKKNIIQNI